MEKKDSSPSRQPGSLHHWDFESGFASDPLLRQGRIRASSWDDSDDNLPSVPENSGSKTCRIYTSDDRKPRMSITSEIDELKKEFFKNLEKERGNQEIQKLERTTDEMERKLNFDRRLSPARIRRRSKSSGSSSSVAEAECQISPTKMNRPTEFETEYQEINPKFLECDHNSYLTNFFTELRSRRISLLDSRSTLEKLGQEVPDYDAESTPMFDESDGKDSDLYFCKTSRKLSKILEVEENKKDLEKSSEENVSNSSLFQKCFTKPENDFSPLQTARSKKSEKPPESQEEIPKNKGERFRSLSSEYATNFQKPHKFLQGSLTDRSARFFDKRLDDDFISLSAKSGKTQLAGQKCLDHKQTNTPSFSPRSPKWTGKNCSEDQDNEKNFDLMKLLQIDLTKSSRSEDRTSRKSTDRSDQATNTTRTKSGKSTKSWNNDSPKFRLNIGMDSGRSLKVEDVNPVDAKPREEVSGLRKSSSCISENSSEAKTDRISQKSMRSPSVESEISSRRSFQEPESMTNRSKSQSNTQRSHRKKRKQRTDIINVDSEAREPNSARSLQSETKELNSARLEQIKTKEPNSTHMEQSKSKELNSARLVPPETKDPNSTRLVRSEVKPGSARLEQFKVKELNSISLGPLEIKKPNSARLVRSETKPISARLEQFKAKEPNSARLVQPESKEPNSALLIQRKTNNPYSARSMKSTEQHSPIVSFRSSENPPKTCETNFSGRSLVNETPSDCELVQISNSKSSTILESSKVRIPKIAENKLLDQLSHQGTPRSKNVSEFGVPLDISEGLGSQNSSHRGIQTEDTEIQDIVKDSNRTQSQSRSHRRSEQNSSSRIRNADCSPRSLKMTPNTDSCSSRRSKDSLEIRDESENLESFRLTSWKEFEKVSDSNRSSASSANRSNEREMEIPSQQYSYRSEIYNPDLDNSILMETFEVKNTSKEQLSGSRNGSRTSLDSNTAECLDNNSSDKSIKTKSRPNSWTYKECTSVIPPDVERLDINPISGRTGSSITEEEEDLEENHSIQRSKVGDESDRFSNKRLSVINEVSFEDLGTSNASTENEEKDTWDHSKSYSGQKINRESPETPESCISVTKPFPKDAPNASSWSLKEIPNSMDDSTLIGPDKGEEWAELISKFQTESTFILGNSFPGFAQQSEISWNSIKGTKLKEDILAKCEEKSEETSNMKALGSKMLEQNLFERPLAAEKDVDNPNLAYQNLLLDKTDQDFTPFQTHHNIHFVNVDIPGPFGIGEFGDVTCWAPEKLKISGFSDIKDIEKPKDHGDGISSHKIPEILPRNSKKTEKEIKNQRQLWRDFTDSAPLLDKPFLEEQIKHISCPLKASKSDSGSNTKVSKESDFHIRASSFFLNDYKDNPEPFEECGRTNSETKSSRKTINQHSSSDSLEFTGRDLELDYERTPRLSRSLSNLDTQIEENLYHGEPSETLSFSGDELFKKTPDRYKAEKESTNLSIFLERKNRGEKNTNNWLKLKQGKRAKRRLKKKGAVSLGEPFHNYLTSRKSRPSVPTIKLRHSNCFQNFYKRFISVFCITSNSSAATSK